MKKIFLLIGATIIALILGAIAYINFALPAVEKAPDITVERTPERIKRGEYLANHVTGCIDCHSKRDWSKFGGPVVEGTYGMGGAEYNQEMGLPGKYYASNITPAGISNYTDGELFRVITTGVTKDGRALFPIMPYKLYGQLDKEDIYSIIAYIRTLEPIENEVPESKSDFPMNFIINLIPENASLSEKPNPSDKINYGKYMATAASCIDCHTQLVKGKFVEGMEFAGGREFLLPNGYKVKSANITPHPKTGIGKWSEDDFLNAFKKYLDSTYINKEVKPGEFNTIMPWGLFAKMEDEDLKAIYAYLKTVKPINNFVYNPR